MTEIDIRIIPATAPAAAMLIAALDRDLRRRYPGMAVNGIEVAGFEAAGGVFAIAYLDGEPAACGAFRPYGDAAEIKRMFVQPAYRGQGLARRVLGFLEAEAARRGFAHAMLETGRKQPEAIGLYASAGWQPIPPFGSYGDTSVSAYFGKRLAGA